MELRGLQCLERSGNEMEGPTPLYLFKDGNLSLKNNVGEPLGVKAGSQRVAL